MVLQPGELARKGCCHLWLLGAEGHGGGEAGGRLSFCPCICRQGPTNVLRKSHVLPIRKLEFQGLIGEHVTNLYFVCVYVDIFRRTLAS